MRFEVFLTRGAERDLEDIYDYLAESDSPKAAARVLDRLMEVADILSSFPQRGTQPRELLDLGIRDYRQVYFQPYRVVYRVIGERVYIYLIADGRRDMQSLLLRRLLDA